MGDFFYSGILLFNLSLLLLRLLGLFDLSNDRLINFFSGSFYFDLWGWQIRGFCAFNYLVVSFGLSYEVNERLLEGWIQVVNDVVSLARSEIGEQTVLSDCFI